MFKHELLVTQNKEPWNNALLKLLYVQMAWVSAPRNSVQLGKDQTSSQV